MVVAQPEDLTVLPGHDAVFSVTVENEDEFQFQWSLGGVALEGEVFPDLLIEKVSREHLGVYSVSVSNGAGAVVNFCGAERRGARNAKMHKKS